MVTGEQIHSTFMSSPWRAAAEDAGIALGVTVSVVDCASGATLCGGGTPCVCAALFGAEPVVGLTCLSKTEPAIHATGDGPIHGTCAAGVRTVMFPVRLDAAAVCHVMISGFVSGTRERQTLLERLLAAGQEEKDARAIAESVPILDRRRAEAVARAWASRAEGLLRERIAADARAAQGCEMAMLAEVARDLGPSDLMYDRIPAGPLRSLARLAGADVAVVHLARRGGQPAAPAARTGEMAEGAVADLFKGAVEHVRRTGRSLVTTGKDESGRKVSIVAVPVIAKGSAGGILAMAKTGGESLGADDMRLAELFAETLGAMLANASEYVDANVKLVELMQVNEVARLLNSTLDQEKLGDVAVDVLSKTLTFDVGGFVLEGFGERQGLIAHAIDVDEAELVALVAEALATEPGSAVLDGVSIVDRSAAAGRGESADEREWTLLSRDLLFRNVRAGELFVASSRAGAFHADDERILGALAAHLSVALENAVLYTRLRNDFQRAMAALSAMADATERLDRGHTDRVMHYAVSLGEFVGLPPERVGLLRFAGLLHDLGKIGVAEEILIKPAMLTDEEMELVRRHSEMGATIVEQVRVLEELTPIVRYHHEHWDGQGYPKGLAGENIPLEARVLAIADAFEAMTGQRPHRKRLPVSAARLEIQRGAGTQFDPQLAVAFLELLDERECMGATGGYISLATGRVESDLPS